VLLDDRQSAMPTTDERRTLADWPIALGFIALWHTALQLVAELWFGTARLPDAQMVDLGAHLALGAVLFVHARRLEFFLLAVAMLMALLHLGNAAKIVILGGPVMPDDLAALRGLFLILHGWELAVAAGAVVVAGVLWAAALRPSWRRGRPATALAMAGVLALWLTPAPVTATLDRWLGNVAWDQRHNF
jgi:hypothetical protein